MLSPLTVTFVPPVIVKLSLYKSATGLVPLLTVTVLNPKYLLSDWVLVSISPPALLSKYPSATKSAYAEYLSVDSVPAFMLLAEIVNPLKSTVFPPLIPNVFPLKLNV